MSLLDEALRKRSQEKGRPGGGPPFPFNAGSGQPAGNRTRRLLLAAAGLAVLVAGAWLFFPTTDEPVRRPPQRPAQPVSVPVPAASPAAPVAMVDSTPAKPAAVTAPTDSSRLEVKRGGVVAAPQKPAKSPRKAAVATPAKPTKAAAVAPASPTVPVPKVDASEVQLAAAAVPFFEKALDYHRERRYDQAITMYSEVLKRHPGHFQTLFNLSAVYLESDAFSQAHRILETLASRHPEDPRVLLNLAVAELGLVQSEQALSSLRQAERNGAPPFDVHLHRGAAFSQLGRLDEAIASYRRAEIINPDAPELRFNLAVALDKNGEYAEALKFYQAFLGQTPFDTPQKKAVAERISLLKSFLAGQSQTND